LAVAVTTAAIALNTLGTAHANPQSPAITGGSPEFSPAAAFDTSLPFRDLAGLTVDSGDPESGDDAEPGDTPAVPDSGYHADGALQTAPGNGTIPSTSTNFEGISNQDNFNRYGFRVNPPDPNIAVGPNHVVEMVNLQFAVYSKTGATILAPSSIGALWSGFAVNDCVDESGDPVVMYDQVADRWILSQFTTRGLSNHNLPNYNCIAVSTSPDPTGTYFRYAFSTGFNFPDYPKYGIFKDSYVITTREFGDTSNFYGIGVYAIDRNKVLNGEPDARDVKFTLDSSVVPISLMGDGLLPAMVDGNTKPKEDATIPVIGTQDDQGGYGASFDALNIWDLDVKWRATPTASFTLNTQLPVAAFDSAFPCGPVSPRDCLPQPGITNSTQFLDVLSYRQRPTWRLAYRNNGTYESLVTAQTVQARPGVAGMRWYEIHRVGTAYSLYQQGTYAPDDGVDRWMGSVAQDKFGNIALGYSVVNGTSVFPGIRYTGRLAGDPLGQMTLGEGTIIDGTGVQRTANSRWGDYTSMNVDPVDDCTFWYVNEYYTLAGQLSSTAGWQTRIASFKLPGC
jgi:hypothetical protein